MSDNAAHGCNDYIIRDPKMEADADALAAECLECNPSRRFCRGFLHSQKAKTRTQKADSNCCVPNVGDNPP